MQTIAAVVPADIAAHLSPRDELEIESVAVTAYLVVFNDDVTRVPQMDGVGGSGL